MSPNMITYRLCTLGESQLQLQGSRSAVLEAGALGVMTADAAVAFSTVKTGAADLWILAAALLGLSLTFAVRTVRLPGAAEAGPSLTRMWIPTEIEHGGEFEESLLEDLVDDLAANERTLARKAAFCDRALVFLLLGIGIELAGRI